MIKHYSSVLKFMALAVALPFIYGCGSGAGTSSLLGFLFDGGAGSNIGDLALLGGGNSAIAGATGVASLVNPEPTSMLLVGGGIMAMTYLKSKSNRQGK